MKILVIHATAGAGHKKAAEAIYNGLKENPAFNPLLVDALDYTNPFFKVTYPAAYSFLVTKLSFIWGFFFALLDIPLLQPLVRLVRRVYNGLNAQALEAFLKKEQFDCIISTQFLSTEVSAYLKRSGQIKSKVICVVTDFDVHRIWVNKGIDIYTGACESTVKKLHSLGVPEGRAFVTGIPTDKKFAVAEDKAALRQRLGLNEGMLTILIATGSFGMGPIEALIKGLKGYQLLVVCGHNKELVNRLKGFHKGHTHILGLVHNMHELMGASDLMVTKPGGLSIAEALVKQLPMVFFSAIPGQETHNIEVLKSFNAADDQLSVPAIIEYVDSVAANPALLNSRQDAIRLLAKPKAVDSIISLI